MGKLTQLWKNKSQILEGIINTVIRDEYVEEVAAIRNSICDDCELKGNKCMVPGTGPCCNDCGCSLKLKTRSLSSFCPHPDGSKWEAILTEEEEDELDNLKN
jgi:hypothetical protein